MTSHKIGVNLRVSGNCSQGGRRYMEDTHAIRFIKKDGRDYDFAYFGIFDGHGGPEASKHARDHLLDEITKYHGFWTDNDDEVLSAIKSGFLDTHYSMWKELANWPNTVSGLPSTSGTTASIAIVKNAKLYVGHVGDSGIVLGVEQTAGDPSTVQAKSLTIDHKPDNPVERMRIEESGGAVVAKAGVQRVVWNRPKPFHKGPIRRSTQIDKIPFLAVARSLGDLWSYDYYTEKFVVSPEPDVSVVRLDPSVHKCLILASDGLWNMITPEESVCVVTELETHFEDKVIKDCMVPVSYWINPAERLVTRAINKWRAKMMKADNTTCVVVLIDPLGPSKLTLLRKKREEHMREVEKHKSAPDMMIFRGGSSTSKQDGVGPAAKAGKVNAEAEQSASSPSARRHVSDQTISLDKVPLTLPSFTQVKPKRVSKVSPPVDEMEDSVQATTAMLRDSTASNMAPPLLGSVAASGSTVRNAPDFARFDAQTSNLDSSANQTWSNQGSSTRVAGGGTKLPAVFPQGDKTSHCMRTPQDRMRNSLIDGSNKLPPLEKAFKFTPDSENKMFRRDGGRAEKERTFTREQSSRQEKDLPFPRDHNNSNINSPPRLRSGAKCKQNVGFAKRTRTMLRRATEAARKAMFPENRLFHTPSGCSPVGVKRRLADSVGSQTPSKRARRSIN